MNKEKREVILTEINHWKKGRLLPEQYCDFLENLYKDEKGKSTRASRRLFSFSLLQQGHIKPWSLSFGIISFFFFIGIYFSFFPWALQISSILLISLGCYITSAVYRHSHNLFSFVMAVAGSLVMLGLGSWTIALQEWNTGIGSVILIAACGMTWIGAGFILGFGMLSYCGFLCVILLYAVLFGKLHPGISWSMLQLLWLPISALVFGFISLSRERYKFVTRVLFAVSLTLWFMPEIDCFLLRNQTYNQMAILVLFKIVLMFLLLYVLRKKWVVWIAS